jgi:hypothetical protein
MCHQRPQSRWAAVVGPSAPRQTALLHEFDVRGVKLRRIRWHNPVLDTLTVQSTLGTLVLI